MSLKKTKPNIEIWLESLESELFFSSFSFLPISFLIVLVFLLSRAPLSEVITILGQPHTLIFVFKHICVERIAVLSVCPRGSELLLSGTKVMNSDLYYYNVEVPLVTSFVYEVTTFKFLSHGE